MVFKKWYIRFGGIRTAFFTENTDILMIHDHPDMMAQEEPTVFYVPLYQFIIRILLGSITVIYFYFLPIPILAFHIHLVILYFLFYFSFHIIWWRHFRQKGIGAYEIRLANWVDLDQRRDSGYD